MKNTIRYELIERNYSAPRVTPSGKVTERTRNSDIGDREEYLDSITIVWGSPFAAQE